VTRAEALRAAAARLREAVIEDARDEARRLLAAAGDLTHAALITRLDDVQPADEGARFEALVARRAAREPLSHILGTVGFWTLELEVTPDVLTPRPDTETVVEAALEDVEDRTAPLRILDVGTGSGAILLALLSELPNATGLATDMSPAALDVAHRNAERNALSARADFLETCWAEGVDGPFDLVVSNPPYLPASRPDAERPPELAHEPRGALLAGPDGLDAYRALAPALPDLLAAEGVALLEIDPAGADAVPVLLREAGLSDLRVHPDLAGRARVVEARPAGGMG